MADKHVQLKHKGTDNVEVDLYPYTKSSLVKIGSQTLDQRLSDIENKQKIATTSTDGLMSKEDKLKLNNIEDNLNNYQHPATHPATMITEDSTHRFVTDTEKNNWNSKAGTATATTSVNGLMSSIDKTKLDSLSNYTHPDNSTTRHVTDADKTKWNGQDNRISELVTENTRLQNLVTELTSELRSTKTQLETLINNHIETGL